MLNLCIFNKKEMKIKISHKKIYFWYPVPRHFMFFLYLLLYICRERVGERAIGKKIENKSLLLYICKKKIINKVIFVFELIIELVILIFYDKIFRALNINYCKNKYY